MAKVNYRQLKRRREETQKKEQLEKQARRGRVPETSGETDAPAPPGTPPPTNRA
jgi:hypothetical protein